MGEDAVMGIEIGTLIYGAGKGILRSFLDFDLCAEPYMKDCKNRIYYFGDLDYEGIGIYESLAQMAADRRRMKEVLESGKYIPQEILNITDF